MTRTELAQKIASMIDSIDDGDRFAGKAWSKAGKVRVYITENSGGKRGWIDLGAFVVEPDGSIVADKQVEFKLTRFESFKPVFDEIMSLRAEPEAVEAKPVVVDRKPESKDEDVRQFEKSERGIYNAESAREQG